MKGWVIALLALFLVAGVGLAYYFTTESPGTIVPSPTLAPTTTPQTSPPTSPGETPTLSPDNSPTPTPTPNTAEEIILESPQEGDTINSPLTITGQARGTWFFEATFPVVLTDWDGRIIAESFATAQDEWMTEEFVPFEAELEFETPDTSISNRGSLILQKANPSGLPENDDALEITVFFE